MEITKEKQLPTAIMFAECDEVNVNKSIENNDQKA